MTGPDPERKAAIRQFVRDHHPDRGGDPQAFAEGLQRLRGERPRTPVGQQIFVVHKPRGPAAVLSWTLRRLRHARTRRHPSGRVQ